MQSRAYYEKRAQKILAMRRKGMTFREIGESLKPPLSTRRIHAIVTTYKEKGHVVEFERLQRKDMSPAYDPKIIKKVLKLWPKNGQCKVAELARKIGVPGWSARLYQIRRSGILVCGSITNLT